MREFAHKLDQRKSISTSALTTTVAEIQTTTPKISSIQEESDDVLSDGSLPFDSSNNLGHEADIEDAALRISSTSPRSLKECKIVETRDSLSRLVDAVAISQAKHKLQVDRYSSMLENQRKPYLSKSLDTQIETSTRLRSESSPNNSQVDSRIKDALAFQNQQAK